MRFIAEICGNHMGIMENAKRMVQMAAEAGCWAVKGQMRDIDYHAKMHPELYNKPHRVARNSFGKLYVDHRRHLELSMNQHKELKEMSEKLGMRYFVSVWDIMSLERAIDELGSDIIKIPSACNGDADLLKAARSRPVQLHISWGMSTKRETEMMMNIIDWDHKMHDLKDDHELVIYHCSSAYPCPFENAYLMEVHRLSNIYGQTCAIGFSSHTKGIAIENAALALGATYFEKHVTLDRTWPGTDQANSLEPQGLKKIIRDLQATEIALRHKPDKLDDLESEQRAKLRGKSRS